MSNTNGLDDVAARVRRLVAGLESGDLSATARRLGVNDLGLRMTIDETSPYLALDVLEAVVMQLGVDPMWLLTGTYDLATHQLVEDEDPTTLPQTLRRIAEQAGLDLTPVAPALSGGTTSQQIEAVQ